MAAPPLPIDQARQTLAWAANFAQSPRIPSWIKSVRQARPEEGDTSSRRGSNGSDTSDAHVEWERARAAALLEGRMSFDDERRAVWSKTPDYPFASKDGSTIRSSYATAKTSTHSPNRVPIIDTPLGWHKVTSTLPIRPYPPNLQTANPSAWLTNPAPPPSLPTQPEFAHRPSWLQSIQSGPYVHRTDAPPITRLYAGPGANGQDFLYGMRGRGDLEKVVVDGGVVRVEGRGRMKRFVRSGTFWLGVMAVLLLLGLGCGSIALAVVSLGNGEGERHL